MARGARSVSVRAERLSQAGCCVRAVVVLLLLLMCRRHRRLVCVFFFRSPAGGGGVASREGEGGPLELELAVIDEKDAWVVTHFLTLVTHVLCHNK